MDSISKSAHTSSESDSKSYKEKSTELNESRYNSKNQQQFITIYYFFTAYY